MTREFAWVETESALRKAYAWAMAKEFMQEQAARFEGAQFFDPIGACSYGYLEPILYAKQRDGDGSTIVHFSPAGRLLKIIARYSEGFIVTTSFKLPSELRGPD